MIRIIIFFIVTIYFSLNSMAISKDQKNKYSSKPLTFDKKNSSQSKIEVNDKNQKDENKEKCLDLISTSPNVSGYNKNNKVAPQKDNIKKESERRKIAEEQEQKKKERLSQIKQLLKDKSQSNSTQQMRDMLNYERLKSALKGFSAPYSVTLLLGNNIKTPTEDEISYAKYLAEFAIEKGRIVVYDADSKLAKYINEVAGEYSVGISSTEDAYNSILKNVVVIKNPYLRMRALSIGEVVTTKEGSISGVGLLFNNNITHHNGFSFFSKNGKGNSVDIQELKPPTYETNFGINFKLVSWLSLSEKKLKNINLPSIEEAVDSLLSFEAEDLIKSNEKIVSAEEELKRHQKAQGAVVFGSGAIPGTYTQLVYSVSRLLADRGIPIVTGGAGGVMKIANQAAYDAGSESIGISLGGRLLTEKETMSSIHTLTINVKDYEERIPLLLQDRKIIIIAPGGNGTMKELATTLVKAASEDFSDKMIVFLGSAYYQNIFKFLRTSLPKEIHSSFYLVNSAAQMENLLDEYSGTIWTKEDEKKVFRSEAPVPRNENIEFLIPKMEELKSISKDKGKGSSKSKTFTILDYFWD